MNASDLASGVLNMVSLSHSVVLREARRLLEAERFFPFNAMFAGLEPDDIGIDRDGVLVCKPLPVNGRISGGIKLEGSLMQMTLDDLSQRHLIPWLGRMGRLKALQEDLKALGVMRDD